MGDLFVNQVQRVGTDDGVLAPGRVALIYEIDQVDVIDDPDGIYTAADGATVTGATKIVRKAGAPLVNPVITGTVTQGPAVSNADVASTTGGSSSSILSLPLADNSTCTLDVRIIARSAVGDVVVFVVTGSVASVVAGVLSIAVGATLPVQTFGITPSAMFAWSGGFLTLSVAGPTATVTGAASASAGAATAIAIGAGGLTSGLSTQSVTISGVVGGTGINGAHVATFVDATHFTIPVAWVGYTSGGTVVFTTPPALSWAGSASIVKV